MSHEKNLETRTQEPGEQEQEPSQKIELGEGMDRAMTRLIHSGTSAELEAAGEKLRIALARLEQSSSGVEKAALDKVLVERIENLISSSDLGVTVDGPRPGADGSYEDWLTFSISRQTPTPGLFSRIHSILRPSRSVWHSEPMKVGRISGRRVSTEEESSRWFVEAQGDHNRGLMEKIAEKMKRDMGLEEVGVRVKSGQPPEDIAEYLRKRGNIE